MATKKPPLEEFYRAAKPLYLPTILRRLKNRADAEDLFHNMIEKMAKAWDSINNPEHYASVIVKNLKIVASNQRKHSSLENFIDYEFNFKLYDNETDYLVTAEELNQEINKLDPFEQEMVQDFFISGIKYNPKTRTYERMTQKEFCTNHGLSVRTLGPALKRIRTEIEKKINSNDGRRTQKTA